MAHTAIVSETHFQSRRCINRSSLLEDGAMSITSLPSDDNQVITASVYPVNNRRLLVIDAFQGSLALESGKVCHKEHCQ